jgi:hypothetical protein
VCELAACEPNEFDEGDGKDGVDHDED